MTEKRDYLIVEVTVMVPIDADWVETWPEERCEAKAQEVREAVADLYPIAETEGRGWWVQ